MMNKDWETIAFKAQAELHALKSKEPSYRIERLRDEFAMHAPEMSNEWFETSGFKTKMPARAAWAYEYADECLKAREQSK